MPTRQQQGSEPQWLLLLTSYTISVQAQVTPNPRMEEELSGSLSAAEDRTEFVIAGSWGVSSVLRV